MFLAIGADIDHPSSADTLSAASNLVMELIGVAYISVSLAQDPRMLRRFGKFLLALCFYLMTLAYTYDTVAHLLPSHMLPTLSEIAPGPVALWRAIVTFAVLATFVAILLWMSVRVWLNVRRRQ